MLQQASVLQKILIKVQDCKRGVLSAARKIQLLDMSAVNGPLLPKLLVTWSSDL